MEVTDKNIDKVIKGIVDSIEKSKKPKTQYFFDIKKGKFVKIIIED